MELEKDLIKACLQNDRIAQRKLYQAYASRMLVVCARYAPSKAEAEDILQEAFIKIFQNLASFRGESTIGAWIKRIVINTAIKHIRSQQPWQDMSDVAEFENHFSDKGTSIEGIHFQELLAMIHKLPKGCQTVFNLYAIEGYKHAEIAKMLGISEGTSKSQLNYAKEKLKNTFALFSNQKIQQS